MVRAKTLALPFAHFVFSDKPLLAQSFGLTTIVDNGASILGGIKTLTILRPEGVIG